MRVLLLHGFAAGPDDYWFPWLRHELGVKDIPTIAPAMPDPQFPILDRWLEKIAAIEHEPADTVVVAHSLGSLAFLHYLTSRKVAIPYSQIILVGSFGRSFEPPAKYRYMSPLFSMWAEPPLDFVELKPQAKKWTVVHSIDDPVVPFGEGEWLAGQLGAEIIRSSRGHYSVGVAEVPEILEQMAMDCGPASNPGQPMASIVSKRQTTLCYPLDGRGNVLLAMKKRGFAAGKLNGPGGKLETGETPEQACRREVREEVGIELVGLEARGSIEFRFDGKSDWDQDCHIFVARGISGEPQETEEMKPEWFPVSDLPFDRMWEDDPHWLPGVLAGGTVKMRFYFDGEGKMLRFEDF